MSDLTYYQRNRERLLEKAKESRRRYYEENKDAIKAKNLARYYSKKDPNEEPGKRGRQAGTTFPEGYRKRMGGDALRSPEDARDVIFEEFMQKGA
jgi:hypothetical protein